MAKQLFFLLLLLLLCNSVRSSKDFEIIWKKEQLFPSIHRAMMEYFHLKMDTINPPLPAPPTTNPVNTAPGIITVPGTNPATPPVTTNPVTPPVTANPVAPPVTANPVSPPVPVSNPVTTPTTSGGNGRWCVAKNGASQVALQAGLDYACGTGGADCATIQQGSSCYEPATIQNHASYAFNSYYQKNPAPTSCDFGGAAAVTTTNPSTGTCVYPSSSSPTSTQAPVTPATASPTTQAPVNPTSLPTAPTTSSSSSGPALTGTQYPPPAAPGFSLGNPDPTGLGAYGASPPLTNTVSGSGSNSLQPFIVILAPIIMFMFGM